MESGHVLSAFCDKTYFVSYLRTLLSPLTIAVVVHCTICLLHFALYKLHNACTLLIWRDTSLSLVLASSLPHKSHRCPLLLCIKCASFSLQSQVISSTLPLFPTIAPMTSIMMDSMYWELIPFMGPAETYLQCYNGIVTHATSSKVDPSFICNCPYLPVP